MSYIERVFIFDMALRALRKYPLMKGLAAGLICLLLGGAATLAAEADPLPKIAFLKFRLAHGQLEWLGAQVVTGRVKTPRRPVPAAGALQVDLLTESDEPLLRQWIPDPSRVRYEYVDVDGHLRSLTVVSDSVEFFVRVPYSPRIGRAVFNRITAVHAEVTGSTPDTESLGTVDIALEAADE